MAATKRSLRNETWFWPVVGAWMSLFALGLVDNARGPVFPDVLRDFQLSDTTGSFFFLVASVASLVHNTIFYRYLCKTDPKRLVGLYTLIMAAGALLISHATRYEWTLVACAVLGVGFGGLGVGQNAAVQEAPPEHRQRAMGLLHTMYGLSSFTAPLLISYFAANGWRVSLAFLSLPSVFVGLFVIYEAERSSRRRRGESREAAVSSLDAKPDSKAELSTSKRRASWFAAILISLLVVAEISVSSRLTLLARREWGFSLETSAKFLAAYFIAMTASRLLLGVVRFPISARNLLMISFFLGLPCLLLGFMPLGFPTEVRLMCLVAFGFPIAMGYPLAMTRIAEIFGAHSQRVTSLCLVVQAAGAMIMHFSLGWGADLTGLVFVLGMVSIASLLGAFAAFRGLERAVLR